MPRNHHTFTKNHPYIIPSWNIKQQMLLWAMLFFRKSKVRRMALNSENANKLSINFTIFATVKLCVCVYSPITDGFDERHHGGRCSSYLGQTYRIHCCKHPCQNNYQRYRILSTINLCPLRNTVNKLLFHTLGMITIITMLVLKCGSHIFS